MIQIPSEIIILFDALLVKKAIPEKFFNAPRNNFRHFSPGPDPPAGWRAGLAKPDLAKINPPQAGKPGLVIHQKQAYIQIMSHLPIPSRSRDGEGGLTLDIYNFTHLFHASFLISWAIFFKSLTFFKTSPSQQGKMVLLWKSGSDSISNLDTSTASFHILVKGIGEYSLK